MSAAKAIPRPGGRSARVQAAVHAATTALIAEQGRGELTVPLIAARAGVTPSTIYRRWGDLAELLADVAVERLRPDGEPAIRPRAGCPRSYTIRGVLADRAVISPPSARHACSRSYRSRASTTSL